MTDPYRLQPNSGALTELRQRLFPEDTTIVVMSHTAFAPAGRIRIGDAELVTYTGKAMSVSPRMPILTGCTRGADREQGGSGPREWNAATQVVQAPYERPELVSVMPAPTADQAGQQVYLEAAEPELSFFAEGEDGSSQRDITTPEQWNAAHLSNFGTQGTANGEFAVAIRGIGVDAATGDVYIASDNRIQVFAANGTWLATLATSGSGSTQVSAPSQVGYLQTGSNRYILIADTGNDRIKYYRLTGATWETSSGTSGTGNGEFDAPQGVGAILPLTFSPVPFYAVDTGNNRIQQLNGGTYTSQFGEFGTSAGRFDTPTQMAVDQSRRLWVVDQGNHRVQVFTEAGDFLFSVGQLGASKGQFNTPTGIAIDIRGNVYVTDSGNHRVQVFDQNGVFQGMFGRFGTGDGQFDTPTAIAVTDDYIYVADSGNFRVQIFTNPTARLGQPLRIAFHEVANVPASLSNVQWSNMPAAETGLFGWATTVYSKIVDLSRQSQIRLTMVSSLAVAGAKVRLAYSTNGSSWTTLTDCLLSTNAVTAEATVSDYVSLPAAARIESCYLRVTGLTGNGAADPVIYSVVAEAR